jgi:hypothetical protein
MVQTTSGKAQLQVLTHPFLILMWQQMFNICQPLQTQLDIATFMSNLMGNWMETGMKY